jgi:hypothetical protein
MATPFTAASAYVEKEFILETGDHDMSEKNLQEVKRAAAKALIGPNYPNNVIGVGIGTKFKKGKDTSRACVRVYVLSKLDVAKLSPSAVVPPKFLGVLTDVIEVGRFGRSGRLKDIRADQSRIGPGCPIRVAANVPNVNSGAFGTLGAVVSDRDGHTYILSCNHILASNGRVPENRNILSNEEPIGSFSGNRFCIELKRGQANLVDCALGHVTNNKVSTDFPNDFPKKWKPVSSEPIVPRRGMKVAKAGAISGPTHGTIVDVDAEGYIDYSFGTFHFDHQVVIDSGSDKREFAVAGDSGSAVIDTDTGKVTAMIFAAAGRFAVACPLHAVLTALQDQLKCALTLQIDEYASRSHASGK